MQYLKIKDMKIEVKETKELKLNIFHYKERVARNIIKAILTGDQTKFHKWSEWLKNTTTLTSKQRAFYWAYIFDIEAKLGIKSNKEHDLWKD